MDGLHDLLLRLSPVARARLRQALILDQADRDEVSYLLLRYRDEPGRQWADLIDTLSMYPDARRVVVRELSAISAAESG